MPRVKVPFHEQLEESDCTVACVMMIMLWARDTYGDVAQFTYDELKKILRWNRDGTPMENVPLMNRQNILRQHRHQPKFFFAFATGLGFIWQEIELKRPMIAQLEQTFPDGVLRHSVVVTGHTSDKTKIYCNDPLKTRPITVPTDRFQKQWNAFFRTCAHVIVEEQETLELDTFTEDRAE